MNMPGMDALRLAHGLLPEWLAVTWTILFLLAAASHLRHTRRTAGQRRSWHACHVLMGVGMAFMFAPATLDPFAVPVGFWKVVFACAGVIAAVWAIGGVGRVASTVWMLTALDLGAMLMMWSASVSALTAPFGWLLVAYLLCEALLWGLDLYRRLDGADPMLGVSLLTTEGSGLTVVASGSAGSLLGSVDINVSMFVMSVGMAYMVAAMVIGA